MSSNLIVKRGDYWYNRETRKYYKNMDKATLDVNGYGSYDAISGGDSGGGSGGGSGYPWNKMSDYMYQFNDDLGANWGWRSQGKKYTEDKFYELYPAATPEDWVIYEDMYSLGQKHKEKQDLEGLNSSFWSDIQKYVESQPGYEAMKQFMPEHLRRINELEQGEMDPYTGQLTVEDPWQRQAMMGQLGGEMFGGGINDRYQGFADQYQNTKDELLPQMDANYMETVVNPMQEKLNAMGMSGSTPGAEMSMGAGQSYAINRALAGAQADNTFAGQLMGVEQARSGAMSQAGSQMQSLMQQGEATERANIGTSYQDWLTHQNDQYTRLGMGANTMQTSAGALSSAAGQGLQASGTIYEQGNAWNMMNAQNSFMAPYLDAASQQLPSSGSGGCGGGGC